MDLGLRDQGCKWTVNTIKYPSHLNPAYGFQLYPNGLIMRVNISAKVSRLIAFGILIEHLGEVGVEVKIERSWALKTAI